MSAYPLFRTKTGIEFQAASEWDLIRVRYGHMGLAMIVDVPVSLLDVMALNSALSMWLTRQGGFHPIEPRDDLLEWMKTAPHRNECRGWKECHTCGAEDKRFDIRDCTCGLAELQARYGA